MIKGATIVDTGIEHNHVLCLEFFWGINYTFVAEFQLLSSFKKYVANYNIFIKKGLNCQLGGPYLHKFHIFHFH